MRHQVVFDEAERVTWHKSSYSGGGGGNCVEVAEGRSVVVRDTQNRELGHLSFASTEWAGLLNALKVRQP
jgi:monoamine oxidase